MRKLKLQMQITIDGFVARPDGQTDWMWAPGPRDEQSARRVVELAQTCDTLLLGRKMTRVFVDHWENIYYNQPNSHEHTLASLMVNIRKIAFSRTQTAISGHHLEVENGDLATAIQALKQQPGKDIIVYGGAGFVSALVSLNLVDEYYLYINPVAIGTGLRIFNGEKRFTLESSTTFPSGKTLNKYLPV
jgi:dihydrofolate reductase